MNNELTDRAFWVNYWESKEDLVIDLPSNYLFGKKLGELVNKYRLESAIELGGFPGYYTVYMSKYFKVRSTLFDYFVHTEITESLIQANGLKTNDFQIIEADLFTYPEPQKKFGMVMSCGLIEHFEDTRNIIEQHLKFLDQNGILFITLPNFTGINGWIQKTFDRDNYNKHNIKCMDTELLSQILTQLKLEVIECRFYGHFGVWLENLSKNRLSHGG
jgi:SAM-dependent methyltransferase